MKNILSHVLNPGESWFSILRNEWWKSRIIRPQLSNHTIVTAVYDEILEKCATKEAQTVQEGSYLVQPHSARSGFFS